MQRHILDTEGLRRLEGQIEHTCYDLNIDASSRFARHARKMVAEMRWKMPVDRRLGAPVAHPSLASLLRCQPAEKVP